MTDKRLKSLTISTNVVKRILKEKEKYEEEVVKQTENYDEKVAKQVDEHDLRMAKAILDESKMMVPDCQIRLSKAIKDLQTLTDECEDELADTEQFKLAKCVLHECSGCVN